MRHKYRTISESLTSQLFPGPGKLLAASQRWGRRPPLLPHPHGHHMRRLGSTRMRQSVETEMYSHVKPLPHGSVWQAEVTGDKCPLPHFEWGAPVGGRRPHWTWRQCCHFGLPVESTSVLSWGLSQWCCNTSPAHSEPRHYPADQIYVTMHACINICASINIQ